MIQQYKAQQVNEVVHYNQCPSCNSNDIHKVLAVTDHTVSNESFEIWHCSGCSLRFTQDIPPENSIGRYYQSEDYISHTDTSKGMVNRLYRVVRQFTLKSKRSLIQSETMLDKGSILDVGAGTGAFVSYMKQQSWEVTALEPDPQARKKAQELHAITLQESGMLFKLQDETFDAITLWHVLEHVHSLHGYMEQLKKLLKPTGNLFIAVPNYTSYDANLYKEFWAAYDVPRHLYHFSPKAMKTLAEDHGVRIKKIKPMWFDSFYVSMLSEKYKTGHASVAKGLLKGTVSNQKALGDTEKASSLIYVITK